jgi:hypothetical protein
MINFNDVGSGAITIDAPLTPGPDEKLNMAQVHENLTAIKKRREEK